MSRVVLEAAGRTDVALTGLTLRISPGVSFDGWKEILGVVEWTEHQMAWAIGDCLVYAEKNGFADYLSQAAKILTRSPKTLANHRRVSQAFPSKERRHALTWKHHELVAGLEPRQRKTQLDRAEKLGWSSTRLQEELQKDEIGPKRAGTIRLEYPRRSRPRRRQQQLDDADRAVCLRARSRAQQQGLSSPISFAVFTETDILVGRFEELDENSQPTVLAATGTIDEAYVASIVDSQLDRFDYAGDPSADEREAERRSTYCPPALT